MPRPRKWRRVCGLPENSRFGPLDLCAQKDDIVTMTVDEYEAIRLIDLDNFTQEQCAAQMKISRTTVQGIYDSARNKLAQSLVNGKILLIQGGEYRLCNGQEHGCRRAGCPRCRCGKCFEDMDTNESHSPESSETKSSDNPDI